MATCISSTSWEPVASTAPLVWSHAEAARAMYVLDAAALKARFGSAGLWAWPIAWYVGLRWPQGKKAEMDGEPK